MKQCMLTVIVVSFWFSAIEMLGLMKYSDFVNTGALSLTSSTVTVTLMLAITWNYDSATKNMPYAEQNKTK